MRCRQGLHFQKGFGRVFYSLRFGPYAYERQITVHAQGDHVTFTILYTKLNPLQRFYRASLGTSSFKIHQLFWRFQKTSIHLVQLGEC